MVSLVLSFKPVLFLLDTVFRNSQSSITSIPWPNINWEEWRHLYRRIDSAKLAYLKHLAENRPAASHSMNDLIGWTSFDRATTLDRLSPVFYCWNVGIPLISLKHEEGKARRSAEIERIDSVCRSLRRDGSTSHTIGRARDLQGIWIKIEGNRPVLLISWNTVF